jgi:hypothetical protein
LLNSVEQENFVVAAGAVRDSAFAFVKPSVAAFVAYNGLRHKSPKENGKKNI